MLTECSLIGFVPTTDADRARRFYVDVLKLEFVSDDHFAVVVRTKQSTVRIVRLKEFTPATFTILGWEVANMKAAVEELARAGVAFVRYPFLEQDENGVWTTPAGSQVAWFLDPDGNVLSLSQHE